ncbi:BMP family lipoprotein [Crassaminicella profunda]|uniref:BMP family lipoprotein n=1 Tax=Crassaminicella profunda TaxID=1286698 RepID=UPI001CA689E0|nr:BMP family ABC transporter substrate-binding protein [Crassaminicella profunda]QZY57331.1 BMP family ABC transporter substrate-binding protein [Crassaminicella profunda]
MFKKGLTILLTGILAAGLLAGCGEKAPEQPKEPAEKPAEEVTMKIAMVTDVGGVNDQSFNQSAWEGLQRAEEELGIKASYKESKQDADYGPNMETLLDDENDLIWGIGFKMGDLVKEEAVKNPEQKYAIIDFAYEETPENAVGVVFKQEQPSFLVGYIAGKMTETGKVGFVGGIKGNVIDGFQYGYMAGVKAANKDVKVLVQYADSFTDAAKGKAIANQMYKDGADIVFHAAGGVGDGVIEAAKEQNKKAIGVDRDQNALAPENVITSAMKRVDNAVFNMAEGLKDGKFPGGTTVVYGLKEGGVDIAPTSDKHVPAEILKEVEELKQQIIDEKIVVPYNEKTFNEFQ